MEERRRALRVPIDGTLATLPTAVNVQVLDISVGGVLLQAKERLEPGTRARLRLNMWGSPFAAEVEVKRVSQMSENPQEIAFGLGAEFVSITPEHRQLIERFSSQ
jgi:hypothetical protein